MVIFRTMAIFLVLAAVISMGVSCSSKEPPNQISNVSEGNQPAAAAPGDQSQAGAGAAAQEQIPANASRNLELTGTVAQSGDRIVLITNMGDYVVSGEDLSGMVGKIVDVTGVVKETEGGYTIDVTSFSVHPKD